MELIIPDRDFGAYIYDCDGTLADTMGLHIRVWQAELESRGVTVPESQFYEWAGIPTQETIELINERFGVRLPCEEVSLSREERFMRADLSGILPVRPVLEHALAQHGRRPLAVVSGGKRASVSRILKALEIADKFDAVVCAEDYARGKPDPEPFLVAAARLGVKPGDCLVFEDAETGIRAAEAAGMSWVRVSP